MPSERVDDGLQGVCTLWAPWRLWWLLGGGEEGLHGGVCHVNHGGPEGQLLYKVHYSKLGNTDVEANIIIELILV